MASGSDILAMIERLLADTRGELDGVTSKLERSGGELERARQSELGALAVLARLRLKEIEGGQLAETLDEAGKRVTELLAERTKAQAAVGTELDVSQGALAKLEQDRAAQHSVVSDAEKAVEAAEAAAQQRLQADAAYAEQLKKAQASDAVADLAEAKAQAAHKDRVEKGKPYETDPLFAYLWSRGYGTSRYRSGALARLLDRWVARVVGFEPLRRDYWMLSELPARFDDHAQRMRELADTDVGAVQALEHAAADATGVPDRHKTLDGAEHDLAAIDEKIHEREAGIGALVAKRASFAAGEDDLSRESVQLLSVYFRKLVLL
jgi:transcriptional regulator with XRE-family HTH domain